VRLTILGSGTAVPEATRGPTSAWLRTERTSVLVDCGSGALQKLVAAGGSLSTLDALVLTHAHLDHTADLAPLLFALRLPEVPRKEPLRIYCSRGTARFIEGLRALYGQWLDPPAGLRVETMQPGDGRRLGDLAVRAFAVSHHETSIGFRFEGPGRGAGSVVIPGDTGPDPALASACRDADVLVIECAATDEAPLEGHMSPTPLIALLSHAQPRRVLLTHLYPEARRADVARAVQNAVSMPVREAEDGLELRVGSPAEQDIRRPGVATKQERRAAAAEERRREEHDLMRQALGELDGDALLDAKYGRRPGGADGSGNRPRVERGAHRVARLWSAGDLAHIELSGPQRQLEKRGRGERTPSVNLRGATTDDAERRLRESVATWRRKGVPIGRVITGKGKQSPGDPVIKLMVLNWLDGEEGLRAVRMWVPERTADGDFGAVILELALG
jgi:ribonuclease BN (tRNA processing enzyme)